jgi:hypothetical protein
MNQSKSHDDLRDQLDTIRDTINVDQKLWKLIDHIEELTVRIINLENEVYSKIDMQHLHWSNGKWV